MQDQGTVRIVIMFVRGAILWESGEAWRGRMKVTAEKLSTVCVCPQLPSAAEEPFPTGNNILLLWR